MFKSRNKTCSKIEILLKKKHFNRMYINPNELEPKIINPFST